MFLDWSVKCLWTLWSTDKRQDYFWFWSRFILSAWLPSTSKALRNFGQTKSCTISVSQSACWPSSLKSRVAAGQGQKSLCKSLNQSHHSFLCLEHASFQGCRSCSNLIGSWQSGWSFRVFPSWETFCVLQLDRLVTSNAKGVTLLKGRGQANSYLNGE